MSKRGGSEDKSEELRRTRRRLDTDELATKYGWGSGDVEVKMPDKEKEEMPVESKRVK